MAKYAFTDIHGNYDLWLAIKNYCKEDEIRKEVLDQLLLNDDIRYNRNDS